MNLMTQIGSHRSDLHENNEDSYLCMQEGNLHYLMVSDGCSSGRRSEFASRLLVYILRSAIMTMPENDGIDLKTRIALITMLFFKELKQTKNRLNLEVVELEATLVFAIVNEQTKEYVCIAYGDGAIVVDNEIIEIDEDNRPNYPVHAFYSPIGEDVVHNRMHKYSGIFNHSFIISTDGVSNVISKSMTFPYETVKDDFNADFYHAYKSTTNISNPKYYKIMMKLWEKNRDVKTFYGDDVTLIRLIDLDELK